MDDFVFEVNERKFNAICRCQDHWNINVSPYKSKEETIDLIANALNISSNLINIGKCTKCDFQGNESGFYITNVKTENLNRNLNGKIIKNENFTIEVNYHPAVYIIKPFIENMKITKIQKSISNKIKISEGNIKHIDKVNNTEYLFHIYYI